MWKAAVLMAVLMASLVQRAWPNEAPPSFYGVKLCGREFIRAVIFTCGGSRWRRSLTESGPGGEKSADPWGSDPAPLVPAGVMDQNQNPAVSRYWREGDLSPAHSPLQAVWESNRAGREEVVLGGLSHACCQWGCSKTEISSLC